jgi:predicted Kef-type K+ transport protein
MDTAAKGVGDRVCRRRQPTLVRPVPLVARFGGREVFTAAALLVVIGSALTMEAWAFPCRWRFLAGVLLADSIPARARGRRRALQGLLLGLFFMAVGMSANLALSFRIRSQYLAWHSGDASQVAVDVRGARVSGSSNEAQRTPF